MKHLKVLIFAGFSLLVIILVAPARAALLNDIETGLSAVNKAAITEARYERLMRNLVNKLKLAFSEADDAKTLEVLHQFSSHFHQQTNTLQADLAATESLLTKEETTALYQRLVAKSHNEEVVSLLFDERITSRTKQNAEISKVLETLHAKSLEIQNSRLTAITR